MIAIVSRIFRATGPQAAMPNAVVLHQMIHTAFFSRKRLYADLWWSKPDLAVKLNLSGCTRSGDTPYGLGLETNGLIAAVANFMWRIDGARARIISPNRATFLTSSKRKKISIGESG